MPSPPLFLRRSAESRPIEWSIYAENDRPSFSSVDVVFCHLRFSPGPDDLSEDRVLWAMGQGKPLVASEMARKVPPFRDGKNGLIVPGPSEWGPCLDMLMSNPQARSQLAQAGLETARRSLGRQNKRKTVAFFVGPGIERWDETSLERGIGGSETAVILLSRSLARLGYEVLIFADPHQEHWDRSGDAVQYMHYSQWERYSYRRQIDYLVCSRTVFPLSLPCSAKRNYVWIHDIALGTPEIDVFPQDVDSYFCLSDWHVGFVHRHHGISLEKLLITTNGVDPSRYQGPAPERIPTQAIYSSSPDRGLDTLLECSETITRFVPDFKLVVAYGFHNWKAYIEHRGDESDRQFMRSIESSLSKPFVQYVDRVGQNELARLQRQSAAWLYPTRFTETNCITAIEVGMAGCAIITSDLAGLKTTVGPEGGVLIPGDAYSAEYRERFIEESVRVLTQEDYRHELANRAQKRMQPLNWDRVAVQWSHYFETGQFERIL